MYKSSLQCWPCVFVFVKTSHTIRNVRITQIHTISHTMFYTSTQNAPFPKPTEIYATVYTPLRLSWTSFRWDSCHINICFSFGSEWLILPISTDNCWSGCLSTGLCLHDEDYFTDLLSKAINTMIPGISYNLAPRDGITGKLHRFMRQTIPVN